MRLNLNALLLTGSLLLAFSACDSNKVYESYTSLPDKGWPADKPVTFKVEIEDTMQACNVHLMVRHMPQYPFQNLYVLLDTKFPDGSLSTDSVQFMLFNAAGETLSDCAGDLCDARFMFRNHVRFPQAGNYEFIMRHAMRVDQYRGVLPFVLDVGIRIETSETPAS